MLKIRHYTSYETVKKLDTSLTMAFQDKSPLVATIYGSILNESSGVEGKCLG